MKCSDADKDDSDEDAFADSDDDNNNQPKTKKMKKSKPKKTMTKREKMDALAKKKRYKVEAKDDSKAKRSRDVDRSKENREGDAAKAKGYDSGDSYNSGEYVRTKEDEDFIDNEGDDEDLIKEYNAEQHFDDERPAGTDSSDEEGTGRKKKKSGQAAVRKKRSGNDVLSDVEDENQEPSNPISAIVWKMKSKKKVKKNDEEIREEIKEFLNRMDAAADEDDKAIKERKPATKKLAMLKEVVQMLTKTDMMECLLNEDLLIVCKRWVQPLPNGTLGNVTVRQNLLQAIWNLNVSTENLKRSGFGKVVMSLHMHPSETPALKRLTKLLIEKWSRLIFNREGNLRERDQEYSRGNAGITGYAKASLQSAAADGQLMKNRGSNQRTTDDISTIIASGHQTKISTLGNNRVQVPSSKGFQFTIRPKDKINPKMMQNRGRAGAGARSELNKAMQKKRTGSKIQRSVQMSADGKGI